MTENHITPKQFSILKRAQSLKHAFRGLGIFLKGTHNSWVQLIIFVAAIILGFYFRISGVEWMLLILSGGFVLTAEAFNTAMEIDMDLASPNFHPYAKDTKDVAAGAVLISAVTASIVGAFIFIPYIM